MRSKPIKRVVLFLCFLATLLSIVFVANQVQATNHPFLMVRAMDYAELRDRANQSPWKEMKSDAIRKTEILSYNPQEDNQRRAGYRLRDVMGYNALAYILDPENKNSYVENIRNTLNIALPDMQQEHSEDVEGWDTNVAFQGGIFNAILALDIIYNDLSVEERSPIEQQIDALITNFSQEWSPSKPSIVALWALYQGNLADIERTIEEYDRAWRDKTTPDGVYVAGSGYAMERLNGCSREQKALGIDVLQYHGYRNYYTDPNFIKLHEWLYGYSHTPDFRTIVFGDSLPNGYLLGNKFNPANCSTQAYRAYKFGDRVRQFVNWQMQDDHEMKAGNAATMPNSRLLTYVLMGDQAPNVSDGKVSPSRIFADGGAWFLEASQSRQALVGALWNATKAEAHSHKETNAIFLSGYGSHLLSNAGFNGWRKGSGEFSWTYLHDRAVSGNTGLIDYEFDPAQAGEPPEANDHRYKGGAGIREGLLTATFDYARGDSGEALPNGKHWRNFHFVHPADGKNGYWFLVDEFTAGTTVHLAFHPYSRTVTTVTEKEEYNAEIVNYDNTELTDIRLNLFFATPPDRVTLHKGVIAGIDLENQYLYPTYTRNTETEQIVTVLFPADRTHTAANFQRIAGDHYTGAAIDHGDGVIDSVVESDGTTVRIEDISLQAARSFFRKVGQDLRAFYAAGRSLVYETDAIKTGFEAEQPLTMYLRDGSGKLISPVSQTLTLYRPGVRQVVLNGSPAEVVQSATDTITIRIPQGEATLELS